MKISEDKINEIRDAIDILDVISQYVSLKKRGKSFVGLCPFHNEKTPSFHVDPMKGFFHCFGCGEGGNAFTFIMKMDKVTFPEAVRTLAKKARIDLPEGQEDASELQETEALYHVNKMAAEFYRDCLYKTEGGKKAIQYLSERKFDQKITELFQLGYAPNRWDGLVQKAERESIPMEHLLKAGLIVERKDNDGYYDRFRGRLMFPIINTSGRVVGFGGRTLSEAKDNPKYINSPETAIYRKSHLLYGLYQSREGIRREGKVLLVEGYTDLMRLHHLNIDYAVATAGTALTEGQVLLISRYSKYVILVYDGDSAGFAATLRGADILLAAGFQVSVAPLPGGSDPDDFLRDQGIDAFMNLLSHSKNIIDFNLDQQQAKQKLDTPAEKSRIAMEVLETISKIKDPVERQLMVRELAEKLGIEEALLHQKIRMLKKGDIIKASTREIISSSVREKAEATLIRMLLMNNGLWIKPIISQIRPDDFYNPVHQQIVKVIFENDEKGILSNHESILSRFSDDHDIYAKVVSFISDPLTLSADLSRLALDCILFLKKEELRQQIRTIREEMRKYQNDETKAEPLKVKYHQIKKELDELKKTVILSWKKMVEKL